MNDVVRRWNCLLLLTQCPYDGSQLLQRTAHESCCFQPSPSLFHMCVQFFMGKKVHSRYKTTTAVATGGTKMYTDKWSRGAARAVPFSFSCLLMSEKEGKKEKERG